MRKVAAGMAWTVLVVATLSVALYVGLLVQRRVNPPVLAVDRAQGIRGYGTGDAVLLRAVAAGDVEPGDVLAVRVGGTVLLSIVRAPEGAQGDPYLRIARPGGPGVVPVRAAEIVGRADQRVPLVGWLLIAARPRATQVGAGLSVVAIVVLLASGRLALRPFLDDDEHEPIPLPPAGALALAAGPRPAPGPPPAPPPPVAEPDPASVTVAPTMAYVWRPMAISPEDLRQVRFAQTRKGYDTDAVDRALDAVATSLEVVLQEREALLERVAALEAEVGRYRGMEGQLGQTLAMAERTAEQLAGEAQAEAQRILAQAQAQAASVTPATAVDPAVTELLDETRAIRSLLQSLLTQAPPPPPPPAQPPAW